ERLLKEGNEVRVVDNLITGSRDNLAHLEKLDADLTIHEVSITDYDALLPIFDGAEVIFHQAALASVPMSVDNPRLSNEHCVTGTVNVLDAARNRGVRRVVYAASSAAYGDAPGEYKHEGIVPAPISPYGVAKLAGEYYALAFNEVYDLETVALRYFNVFGARQDPDSPYAAVIPIFITRMLDGKQPIIYGTGEQSRDFTYIDNIVHGNILASQAPDAAGKMMNLATGEVKSLLQLVDSINNALDTDIQAIHEPARAGDILHSQADISRAQDLLDFAPIVDFDEGLRRTATWYRENAL
ncbi:MAG: NAD-dependent epimerase/dehydratase family protein, partial [Chloroflexota bacterium]